MPIATVEDLARQEQQSSERFIEPPPRELLLFEVRPDAAGAAAETPDDSFFDVTVEDAKRRQRELAEQA